MAGRIRRFRVIAQFGGLVVEDMSQQQTADRFGISATRIYQLKERALNTIRKKLELWKKKGLS